MATYTVSGGGAALENCIRALPNTATEANPHIIFVEPGVYSPVVLTGKETTHGAAWSPTGKYHIIIGANRDTCIVDGGGTDVCWQYQWQWGGNDFCRIYNMTFRNGIAKSYPANYTTTAAAVQVTQSSANNLQCSKLVNCKICDCTLPMQYVRDNNGVATDLVNSVLVHRCSLYGCEICNNTCTGTNTMIESSIIVGCNIHHNYYKCLSSAENLEAEGLNKQFSVDGVGMCRNTRRERCIFHHNTDADNRGSSVSGCILASGGANECIVAFNEYVGIGTGTGICYRCGFQGGNMPLTHCVFYGNTGFRYDNSSNGNYPQKMENCAIFANTSTRGFDAISGSGNYGECYNNATDALTTSNDGTKEGNILGVSDPGFVDPSNLDFRLLPASPLIGVGRSNIGIWRHTGSYTPGQWFFDPTTCGDLLGRSFKEPPSIGAFEYYENGEKFGLKMPSYMEPFGGFQQNGA